MKGYVWIKWVPYYLLAAIFCIGAASWFSGAVTTSVQDTPVVRQHTVIVDAGHGGIDGGATSCTGVLESNLNLQIALRLRDLLQLLGYDTVMIRTTDTSVYTEGSTIASQKVSDLKERVRICNETDQGVLISVHQNTFSDARYSGAQIFFADTEGSKQLAEMIQSGMAGALHAGNRRTAKQASNVYLLQNIHCTGVLVECGFLSNPEEEALLRDAVYQQKLCSVIVSSLSEFLKENG